MCSVSVAVNSLSLPVSSFSSYSEHNHDQEKGGGARAPSPDAFSQPHTSFAGKYFACCPLSAVNTAKSATYDKALSALQLSRKLPCTSRMLPDQ